MKDIQCRIATRADLPDLIRMLADDSLGQTRERFESPLPAVYVSAFDAIERDPNNELIVATIETSPAAMLQLTYLPNLSRLGSWRAQIEGVRVAASVRGEGVGQQMLDWALARARDRGCRLAQLTTDRARPQALRFYEKLGFQSTHHGMKRDL